MTISEFLKLWPYLPSREGRQMFASGSERRRWFERGSVHIDGEPAQGGDLVLPWSSVVLHPSSARNRTTLFPLA